MEEGGQGEVWDLGEENLLHGVLASVPSNFCGPVFFPRGRKSTDFKSENRVAKMGRAIQLKFRFVSRLQVGWWVRGLKGKEDVGQERWPK